MSDATANARAATERPVGHLLEFLCPGLVHGLGNSLFAIRGAAHVLGAPDRDPMRAQRVVVEATEQAETLLEILRHLSGVDPARPLQQPGILMQRLVRVLRIPMRDHGLAIEAAHGSHETPVAVDACSLTRALCEVAAALCRALPPAIEGRVVLDLVAQARGGARIEVALEADAACLPFPLEIRRVADLVRDALARDGVAIEEIDADRLALTIR